MRHRALFCFLLTVAALLAAGTGCAGRPYGQAPDLRMDGAFKDWGRTPPKATDPAGDAAGAFDLTEVYVTSRGTKLFLRFDTGQELNIQAGPEEQGTLRAEIHLPDEEVLVLDLRGRKAYVQSRPEERIPWERLNFIVAPTHSADQFELQVDLGPLGVERKDWVDIQFAGSDTLRRPIAWRMAEDAEPLKRRSPLPTSDTDVRVASYNTLRHGLMDPDRLSAFGRLLRMAAADVYCFQEEWPTRTNEEGEEVPATTAEKMSTALDRIMPQRAPWNMHRVKGCWIVSPYPLEPIPTTGESYAGAVVELPRRRAIAVFSVHFECCGYQGSEEDKIRIEQAHRLSQTIADLRAGKHGEALEPYRDVPVVVIGDYNLVGSRTPLKIIQQADSPPLEHWMLPQLVGESVATWRGGPEESFAPGMLDLVTYSPAGLLARRGFVVDTGKLSAVESERMRVRADDSDVSDHLMLVVDFRFLRPPLKPAAQ
jgi:endonuclease/exonuclease/phosphatase family metal-dependent hydrolase